MSGDDLYDEEIRQLHYQQALNNFPNNHILLDTYKLEKEGIDEIINLALNYPTGASRWIAYEVLKKQAALLVGVEATRPELASQYHYITLTDFIDYLLPVTTDEQDTPQHLRYINQEELLSWQQQAQRAFDQQRKQRNILSDNEYSGKYLLQEQMTERDEDEGEDEEEEQN